MMPSYWLPRPAMPLDAQAEAKLEALYQRVVVPGKGLWVRGKLPVPVWQFLCWLSDSKGHLLHGTGDATIRRFEPRQSNDVTEFGNRKAVYAASDGLWAMFFAVINRTDYPMGISNAAVRLELPCGSLTQPYYFFSMSDHALAQQPWRGGVVYVLPKTGFEAEPAFVRSGMRVHTNQWASLRPVKPLAKIRFSPQDFPLLSKIRPHNDELLGQRIRANPQGFPWVEPGDPES